MDPEEEGLADSQVPRLSAKGGAGKQKPRGISFAKPSLLTGLVWSVSTLVVRGMLWLPPDNESEPLTCRRE